MTNHMTNAIEAVAQARMEQNECAHTISNIECDMHGELFVITDYADIYGHLMPTGYCPIARQEAEAIIEAAMPHIRAMVAQEILEAARASADSQQKHDLENGYWDGIGTTSPNAQQWHQAGNWASNTILKNGPTQIAKGPYQ